MTNSYAPIAFGHVALQNMHLYSQGSLIASVVVPASAVGLPADTALWECEAKDLPNLYFLVATNGTGRSNALYPLRANDVGDIYPTMFKRIGIHMTMNGTPISHTWTRVPLPSIQPDTDGRVYIRLQHIPPLHAQLHSIWGVAGQNSSNCGKSQYPGPDRNDYDCAEPQLHIQLAGVPELIHDEENSDSNLATYQSARNHHNGFGYRMFKHTLVSTTPSCVLRSLTPQVIFPPVSARDLDPQRGAGRPVSARISVQLECEGAAISGLSGQQTAISLQASPNAYAAAQRLGITDKQGGGTKYLVSDLYGHDPMLAQGVGISLHNGEQQRYFSAPTDPGDSLKPDSGWYPFKEGANCKNVEDEMPGGYGYQICQLEWTARLEQLPGQKVTPGGIYAVARLNIKVP